MKKTDYSLTITKIFFTAIVFIISIIFLSCDSSPPPEKAPKPKVVKKKAKPGKNKKVIKIGVIGAHKGDLSSLGLPALRAAELAVEKLNAKGGIFSRKIELIVEDDSCQPEKAEAAAKKMVASGVRMVLGHTCSGATRAALDIYKDANVIAISPSATNPALTEGGDYPNFFRSIAPDDAQAELQIHLVTDYLKLKKAAMIHDQDDYGKGLIDYAIDAVKKSGMAEIVLHEEIKSGKDNYSGIIRKIKQSEADVVIYGGYHPEASKIVMEMGRRNMKSVFISGDGAQDAAFIRSAGQYAEGVYVTGPQDTSRKTLAINAIELHKKRYNSDPGPFFLNSYAAALAIFNAIEKSGSLDYKSISKFLRLSYVATPLGTIHFDKKGDVSGYGFSVYRVQSGKFVEMNISADKK
ncbi:branched-chain amino acid ABC transporter substrate-binding protein [Desulfobacterales bacterium HSG16]|nr:branched-chain amino acid ABC transporter substrate-binding protein [Desulfobacterales bacterium HSG16]